jgi:hypothetical protein
MVTRDHPPCLPPIPQQRGGKGVAHYEDNLTLQLSALGLRVKKITADGNCFFRSLSDQLQVWRPLAAAAAAGTATSTL